MAERQLALWKRLLLYSAFGAVSLVAAFFLTFPYDALADRLKVEADAAGFYLRVGSLGPGLLALRATDLQVSKKARDGDDQPPEALRIDSVSVGPSLFPPGLKVKASLLGGSAFVRVAITGSVLVELDDLDLSKGNVKGFTGMDLSGLVNGELAMVVPNSQAGNGPKEPDLGQASGSLTLDAKNLAVNGGQLSLTIPMYGPEPTPLDLPKIAFGDVAGKVTFEKGAGKVEEFKARSTDLELAASGTLKLAKRVEYSELAMEVRFKPDPEFQKRLGLIGSALSMVGPDPKDPTWRMGRLTGFAGKPAFR